MPETLQTLLFAFGSLAACSAGWCLVLLLLGQVSGWSRLAGRYATDVPQPANSMSWMSGSLGRVNYNLCLALASGPDALDLRVLAVSR